MKLSGTTGHTRMYRFNLERHLTLAGFMVALLFCSSLLFAQDNNGYTIASPDGATMVHVIPGSKLTWSVTHKGQQIIQPSAISLQLADGAVLGDNAAVISADSEEIDTGFTAINYKKTLVPDHYNQLTLRCEDDFGVIFRVYDQEVAYRFFTEKNGEIIIRNEEANFNFTADHDAFIPYLWDYRGGKIYNASFESLYDKISLSQFASDSLAILPLLVDVGQGKKVAVLEADLEEYPGMFLVLNETGKGLKGLYAPYPLECEVGGYNNINYVPTKRADYIAKTDGTRQFPWRAIVISESDKELLNNDIVQKLASPARIKDTSWIIPGQVAWDWWNNWSISHVDFEAGINTRTYKYFIDFAADNGIPYIIIDAGWSDRMNLSKTIPEIDLQEIVDYGKKKDVGVVIWATWYAITQQMYDVFPLFEKIGIKGLKIDFIDRDDQIAVSSTYEIAELAAKHHLLVDYHGVFKPTGLQRTFPNVVGYEGVKGLENAKWVVNEDMPGYAVTIPFIRMMAGPMDYTPGAMRNSNRRNFRPINDYPMSQGTRGHQLAMYVVYEVPFQMLSDTPNAYMQEQECTDFITSIPTVFDETVALDGEVGEYLALARKKDDTWYVAAMTNWSSRELTLDFSFLENGTYRAVIFKDGINANQVATDYVKDVINISSGTQLIINLASGGGWAARIEKIR